MIFPKGPPSSGQEASEPDSLNRTTTLLSACFSTFFAIPANATPATTCTPARAGAHVAEQPEAWRRAVEALLASSASPDQPWSCVGGEVDLVVGGSSAQLTVVDAEGHRVSREITSPEDVAPLGEALLSKPLPGAEPAKPPPAMPQPEPESTTRDARLLLAATVGPRYAGPAHLMWGSFGVLAAVPFKPWGAGMWIRYDGFSTALDAPVPSTRDLCIGAAGFWSMSVGRLEIRPMVRPSLAIVTRHVNNMNRPISDDDFPQPIVREETEFDFRLGAEAQFVVGLTKRLRAVIGVDAEVSPGRLFSTTELHRGNEIRSVVPGYTMGLGLGVEVAVP